MHWHMIMTISKKTHEDLFLEEMKVTKIETHEIKRLERQTVTQNKSKVWKEERCKRLCSSNFGRICKSTVRADKKKLARNLMITIKLRTAPIVHGQKYEGLAISNFMRETGCKVEKWGMFVSKETPFLAASPEGIITNDNGQSLLVEVKYPYTAKDKNISHKTVPYLDEKPDGSLDLNKNHNYYYQIQGQLYCTNKNKCKLIVFTLCDTKYISVERDDTFIKEMLVKLREFFDTHFKDAYLEQEFYKPFVC